MKCTIVSNGDLSLVIVPENELETQVLKELFKGPVESQSMDKVQIIGSALQNAVVIKASKQEAIIKPKESSNPVVIG